jgi:hypothetical protein
MKSCALSIESKHRTVSSSDIVGRSTSARGNSAPQLHCEHGTGFNERSHLHFSAHPEIAGSVLFSCRASRQILGISVNSRRFAQCWVKPIGELFFLRAARRAGGKMAGTQRRLLTRHGCRACPDGAEGDGGVRGAEGARIHGRHAPVGGWATISQCP